MLKKIAKIAGIVLLVLLLLAFLLPFFFKGKILAVTRKQINDHVNARVEFKDVSLSLFRHFPSISVALEDLDVIGVDDFDKDTLISARQIDVAVNLFSLIGSGPMKINSIGVDQPRIHALVHADGKSNWNISKPDSSASVNDNSKDSAGSFHLELQAYSIKNGYLLYQDIPGDMSCEISGLNHSGSGDFTSDLFTLKTKTSTDAVSFTYAKVPYLYEAKTSLGADFTVDNKNNKYSFKTEDVAVNDLKLSTEGYFQFVNDTTYGMDIKFSAPSTEFKTLLSLVPAVYKNDFSRIQTSGKALFNGFVKGEYNSAKIPAYQVNLNVDNGFFKYPDLPEPVKNIGIVMKIDNPDGVTDHTVIDISKGHIEFGADPFDFRLLLRNPVTDQYIDAAMKGKLNLAQVTKFVKLGKGTTLSGQVDADVQAKGDVASVMKQKPGPFSASGVISITGLNYASGDFPTPVKNTNVQINFENTDGTADHTIVKVPAGHVEIGSDPVDFTLLLRNPVSNLYFEGSAKGRFNLANVAQFTSLTPGTSVSGAISADMNFKGNKSAIDAKNYEKIYSAGSLNVENLLYKSKDYPGGISVPQAAFTFNPQNITLNSATAVYLNTHYTANGTVDNAIGYALNDEPISGTLNVKADDIDLNKLMRSMPATPADSSGKTTNPQPAANAAPFAVPKNIAFILNAAVDKLKYDKVVYSNVKGTVAIKDESVALKDVTLEALDGKIGVSGLYSTKVSKKNPDISFAYDLSGLDVQKTVIAFNTVQQLMPAAKYVTGKVNSHLTLSGSLTPQMSPDLKSLTGKGTLDMIDGAFKNFTPLEKLSSLLHIDALNNTSLKDIKLSYDFANGRVLVKPFKVNAGGVFMYIAGTHGFDQTIDYVIGMKMPRSILGGSANSLISSLASQATAKGIPVKISDSINLNIRMGGTMTNPQLKTGLGSSGGGGSIGEAVQQQATVFAKQAVDSAKTVVNEKKSELKDSAVSIKNQAIKDLQSDLGKAISGQKDSANGKPLQSTQKNAEDALKNTLNGLFQKKKK